MKLLKKLLPLGIVAATASAVVPMAVSCGTKEFNGTTDPNFKPDEKHKAVDFVYDYDAMLEYANNAIQNPNIIAQDFYWSMAQGVLETEKEHKAEEGYKDGNISFSVEASNVSLRIVSSPIVEPYFLLSADVEYKLHDEYNTIIEKIEERYVNDVSAKISFKNIPIYIDYDETPELEWRKWSFSFDDTIHDIDTLNAITTNYEFNLEFNECDVDIELTDGEITDEDEDEYNESKSINKDNIVFEDFIDDVQDIGFFSYYLLDCSIA